MTCLVGYSSVTGVTDQVPVETTIGTTMDGPDSGVDESVSSPPRSMVPVDYRHNYGWA